jgi:hypothetical protein
MTSERGFIASSLRKSNKSQYVFFCKADAVNAFTRLLKTFYGNHLYQYLPPITLSNAILLSITVGKVLDVFESADGAIEQLRAWKLNWPIIPM